MNFNIVKMESKKPLFWKYEEYNSFVSNSKYNKVTFDRFLNILDDYYLLAYSSLLSRNGWLVFSWIRMMSDKDGFVYASYDEIIDVFCKQGTKISKPTFFRCIEELEKQGLIVSINTKSNNLKSSNIYGVVDKTYIVYQVCDIIEHNFSLSTYDALAIISSRKQKQLFNIIDADKKSANDKKRPRLSDDKKYKLLMNAFFKPIEEEIEELFMFFGSFNKTGKIALSRKLKVLVGLKEYLDCDFELDDFITAFNITMKNTRRGKNPYRERYMFKILENMCEFEDEETDDNFVADELSKKATDKLYTEKRKNTNYISGGVRAELTKQEYEAEKKKIMSSEGYYKRVLDGYSVPINKYEENLVALAKFEHIELYIPQNHQ